jgi:hypothetical protein
MLTHFGDPSCRNIENFQLHVQVGTYASVGFSEWYKFGHGLMKIIGFKITTGPAKIKGKFPIGKQHFQHNIQTYVIVNSNMQRQNGFRANKQCTINEYKITCYTHLQAFSS